MSPMVPLPQGVQARLGQNTHPGLALDKYAESWDADGSAGGKWQEKVQKPVCEKVAKLSTSSNGLDLTALLKRRSEGMSALNAKSFSAKTSGPLTLHLARASVLENAGICLHPLYGFAYLPGTGLKGMARAYAETVWLAGQPDKAGAWLRVEEVFGWAPGSDQGKTWKPPEARSPDDPASSGAVVFHDAWPQKWPKLVVDIVNCHHPAYYQGKDAPGDWENPSPVCFLAVPAGVTFSFALSKARADAPDERLDLAQQWLVGALEHAGAGAKTAAGYGTFRLVAESEADRQSSGKVREVWTGALDGGTRAESTTELELVSPAFLAGASQQQEDCDLRPATLRGLLRWWWRTMHAASVDVPTLRRLEAAVWGDTGTGGAVRVEVEHLGTWNPELYDKASKARMSDAEKKGGYGIPGCDPRKTTQGLWYASYGMHEKDKRRWLVPPGSRWEIRLSARSGRFPADAPAGKKLPAKVLLSQARAALWLLCRFGGVGSKPRKGFGSFRDIAVEGIAVVEDCLRFAREFRQACSVDGKPQREPGSSALDVMLGPLEVGLTWKDPWFALDQAGFAAQAFAQGGKHQDKSALGLPRRGSRDGPKGKRYASPVHYHLARGVDGRLAIRVVAFPANLPDFGTSREVMGRLLESLRADLARRAALPEPTPHQPGPGGQQQRDFRSGGHDEAGPRPAPATSTPPAKRPHGTGVTVKILGRRDKGGYRVQEAGRPEGALVLGTEPQPPPEVGAEVSVFLKDDGPPPQYTWDQPKPTGGGATPRRHVRR